MSAHIYIVCLLIVSRALDRVGENHTKKSHCEGKVRAKRAFFVNFRNCKQTAHIAEFVQQKESLFNFYGRISNSRDANG